MFPSISTPQKLHFFRTCSLIGTSRPCCFDFFLFSWKWQVSVFYGLETGDRLYSSNVAYLSQQTDDLCNGRVLPTGIWPFYKLSCSVFLFAVSFLQHSVWFLSFLMALQQILLQWQWSGLVTSLTPARLQACEKPCWIDDDSFLCWCAVRAVWIRLHTVTVTVMSQRYDSK